MTAVGAKAQTSSVSNWGAVGVAFLTATSGVLPPFLLGAEAVLVRADLRLSSTTFGLIISLFFVSTAVFSRSSGAFVDRLGWPWSVRTVIGGSSLCLLAMAAMGGSAVMLSIALVFGGVINSMAIPAANLILAREVDDRQQGLTFGMTQAAIPAAGLIAGASVPVVGLTVGWRWALLTGVVVPFSLFLMRSTRLEGARSRLRSDPSRTQDRRSRPQSRSAVLLALTGGVGAAITTVLGAFYVSSVVGTGVETGRAGLLLVLGSAIGLITRVASGWLKDQRPRSGPLTAVAGLLAAGSVGFLGLAFTEGPLLLASTVLAFFGGWGWPALFHLAVVRSQPGSPAAATGSALSGMAVGAAAGPLAFGALLEATSSPLAWSLMAGLSLLASLLAFGPTGSAVRQA